jgi:ribose transport system permease protein
LNRTPLPVKFDATLRVDIFSGDVAADGLAPGMSGRRLLARGRAFLPTRLRAGASAGIWVATALLFLLSWGLQPRSVSQSALLGMLPFAAILAIVAIGQTLVIQQGGIDLSVPGVISLTVVIITFYPGGDSSKLWTAILIAYGVAIAAGLVSGLIVSKLGITPIVTTLGMNALLYGVVLSISGGTVRYTTERLHTFATDTFLGIPSTVYVAVVVMALVGFVVKRTVVGRRFEAVGANAVAARAGGLEPGRYRVAAYVGATILYCTGGILLAGVILQPSSFQGDSYLLPSVAAVVLGGTSLLGGVGSAVASAAGALFLTQLEQLVLTTGVNTAVQYLIEAAAIAGGVAVHSVRGGLPAWLRAAARRDESSSDRAAAGLERKGIDADGTESVAE